jgi:hypothetical protein
MSHFGTKQEQKDYFAKFETYGESEVRIQINKGIWSEQNRIMLGYAQEWLRLKDESRSLEASVKRDTREEETLSIAKMALVNSKRANISAIIAAIFTAAATIIAALISIKNWS